LSTPRESIYSGAACVCGVCTLPAFGSADIPARRPGETMTSKERILAALTRANGPVCDDCLSEKADVRPRQQVNGICNPMGQAKIIVRQHDTCVVCHKLKLSSRTRSGANAAVPVVLRHTPVTAPEAVRDAKVWAGATATATVISTSERAWHWEGRIQSALAKHLLADGWEVRALADTESKEQGPDLVAAKGPRTLAVEVKGFPTDTYEHGARRGEPKPTLPTNQARQWFSHASLKVMLLRGDHPEREIAACFPDFPTYRNLANRTRSSFEALGVGIYFVREDGAVDVFVPHREVRPSAPTAVAT
jgi:hypothetical protein